ncbi:MAG TPA: hypothetical protein VFV67_24330 [Actinophytocola sp.]|uniref:hypothetical protein n=1 Tax=Actinophytocola sp. TaxID=1872138 RepID=UPI002DB6C4A4|nr:hypothetical protein [Actinophytocola sp.]HEU5473784.1 hypothetical protein [Actinophytocola sp.]
MAMDGEISEGVSPAVHDPIAEERGGEHPVAAGARHILDAVLGQVRSTVEKPDTAGGFDHAYTQ